MFVAQQNTTTATNVVGLLPTSQYLVLDVETRDAPESAIEEAINLWKPGANSKTAQEINADADKAIATWRAPINIKDPAKIEERRKNSLENIELARQAALTKLEERKQEDIANIRSRSALLDAAPIMCIGVQTQDGAVVFNGMDSTEYGLPNVRCVSCGNERDMLIAFRQWVEVYTNTDTWLVGHNIKGFDLPKLRSAFMRWKLKLPAVLAPKVLAEQQLVVDTAALFRSFSVEHRDDFCPSLSTMCASLGIPAPKGVMAGSDIPGMYRAGWYLEILTYNAIDVAATTRAYLLMSGQASDLE